MGLFDSIFGLNKATIQEHNIGCEQKNGYDRGSVTATKIDLTAENYDKICKSFIAFDTETTGLSSVRDVIIEVGAVKFIDGKEKESYGSLVNEKVTVPYAATQINHISTNMLRREGKSPEIVYRELVGFLEGALRGEVCLCAHNAPFDMSFLTRALERMGYSGNIQYIDTLELSRNQIKGLRNYKQDTVASFLGLSNPNSHRAVFDAELCGKILVNLLELKKEEIEKEKIKEEKSKPADNEKEIIAIIVNAMRRNGCKPQDLRAYRNSSSYVLLLDPYIILRFKVRKKQSYVIIPKSYSQGIVKIEECSATEGITNVRILFDDPFELENYGKLFSKLYNDMRNSQGKFMNQYELQFFERKHLTCFTERELLGYINNAKERKEQIQRRKELEKRTELERVALKRKSRGMEKIELEQDIKKKECAATKNEQKELLKKISDNSECVLKGDVIRIAEISAQNGKRAVIQLDDAGHILKVYESISSASSVIGIAPKTIRDVANGKYKHGGGFCWMYADEYNSR